MKGALEGIAQRFNDHLSVVFGVRKNQNLFGDCTGLAFSTKFQDSTFRQDNGTAITPDFCHIHITLNSIHMGLSENRVYSQ